MIHAMKFLITAGPTREPLDPVRFLSNRSSGRMGYALAEAALHEGHHVILISGPTSLDVPPGVDFISVETAQEMYDAVRDMLEGVDIAILSAAVADYRPTVVEPHKIKKSEGMMTLRLERTPDILGSMRSTFGFRGVLVGFAAETRQMLPNARSKLQRKGCDMIVANDVSQPGIGFGTPDNEVVLVMAESERALPRESKEWIAMRIVEQAVAMMP